MRIKDPFIFERGKEHLRDFKRNYFIAFEGLSEYQYFDGIKTHRDRLGINNNIGIQLLSRFDQDIGESDPRNIVKEMEEYRRLISTGEYSISLFVGDLVQQLYNQMCKNTTGNDRPRCMKALSNIRKTLISKLETSECVADNRVKGECWDDATELCQNSIQSDLSGGLVLHSPPSRLIETYDPETDIFCLVVDRDRKSRPLRYYKQLMSLCEREKISLHITNPCFEFWLYLHFDVSLKISNQTQNILESGDPNKHILDLLTEEVPSYKKNDIDFENVFLNRIDNGISNSKSFETQLNNLENHIGSNIGNLIEKIRSNQ